ncbi:MAG: HAD family phosphatase [Balneolaceae bacterium]|nr:HAD family phosphatase [Balneolaceae bacterium]
MKAVLFDMDGTMIDNMMVHHKAWQTKLSEVGIKLSLEEVHQRIHGVNVELLEREFPGRFTLEERIQISKEKEETYRQIYAPDLALLAGLPELLFELKSKNILLGVGSAAPPENVDFVMNSLDLWHYFASVRHSGDVQRGKPDPQVYELLIADLEVKPEDCIIFEDTPTGAMAASASGAQVIVVTTTHKKEEFSNIPGIKLFISDFTEITFAILSAL